MVNECRTSFRTTVNERRRTSSALAELANERITEGGVRSHGERRADPTGGPTACMQLIPDSDLLQTLHLFPWDI